jgi:hypothetical protein
VLVVQDNMVFLLFAGHDLTAVTALMILYCLGKDARIVAKLRAEQSQALPTAFFSITASITLILHFRHVPQACSYCVLDN